MACEILTSDVPQINDALGADESLLNRLYGFLQSSGSLNPLLASFFSKVMGILINRKTDQVPAVPCTSGGRMRPRSCRLTCPVPCVPQLVSFLRKKDDFVDLLLQHIGTSAIMDLLLRLLTCVERPQLRQEVVTVSWGEVGRGGAEETGSVSGAPPSHPQWLNEEKIVQRLIEQIHPSKDDNVSVALPAAVCVPCQSPTDSTPAKNRKGVLHTWNVSHEPRS